uniref:Amino acid transporter transmembrane domain-containing protein n=1 Tax=Romanomermis culicivorax TaxID=13658 RepID=A0A915KXP5_ROMCU
MLPIENKLRNPQEMTQNCGVLPAAMGLVSAIFLSLGFFGYVAFGDQVQSTITLNMPRTPFYLVVNLTLVVAAYIGHVVNLYVVVAMLWPGTKRKGRRRFPCLFLTYEMHLEILFRICLVLATYFFAVLVPKLELMIPLIGITAGIMIAFIFPPFFEMLTFWREWRSFENYSRKFFYFKLITNSLIIISAGFIMVFGLYQNLYLIYTTIYS